MHGASSTGICLTRTRFYLLRTAHEPDPLLDALRLHGAEASAISLVSAAPGRIAGTHRCAIALARGQVAHSSRFLRCIAVHAQRRHANPSNPPYLAGTGRSHTDYSCRISKQVLFDPSSHGRLGCPPNGREESGRHRPRGRAPAGAPKKPTRLGTL